MKPLWVRRVALAASVLWPSLAGAQQALPWDSIEVPGTTQFIAWSAGWNVRQPERTSVVRELLSYLNNLPGPRQRELALMLDRLEQLGRARQAIAKLGAQPLVLKSGDRAQQRAWQDLFEEIGYRLQWKAGTASVSADSAAAAIERRRILTAAGLNLDRDVPALLTGTPTRFEIPTTVVPLPMGLERWSKLIAGRDLKPHEWLPYLVSNRNAAMIYIGLTGLDPKTLGWFQAHPQLLKAAAERPVAFASFSRSLRVDDGRVVVPGGPDAVPLWEELVGAPPGEPLRFFQSLMLTGEGRLGWFFDTVVHLEPRRQKYALGLWLPSTERGRQLSNLYDSFLNFRGDTRFMIAPLTRSRFDPAMVLQGIEVAGDGRPLSPTSVRFVSSVLNDVDIDHDVSEQLVSQRASDLMTASRLVDQIFVQPSMNVRPRAEAYFYAQRLLSRFQLPPADVALLTRGHLRYPALVGSLERLGLPTVDATIAAIRRADQLRKVVDLEAAHVSLLQFQGGLALVAAARLSGSLAVPEADALISSLSLLEPHRSGYYFGAVSQWLAGPFMAAIRMSADAPGPTSLLDEEVLLRGLSGFRQDRSPAHVKWNEFPYVVALPEFQYARISAVRTQQNVPPLQAVLDFNRGVQRIKTVTNNAERGALAQALKSGGTNILKIIPKFPKDTWLIEPEAALAEAVKMLNRMRPGNAGDILAASEDFGLVADWVTAYSALGLVYAAHEANGPRFLGGDVSPRHDLGTFRINRNLRADIAWSFPIELRATFIQRDCPIANEWNACPLTFLASEGVLWHMEGSLLGLDLATGAAVPASIVRESSAMTPNLDRLDRASLIRSTVVGRSGNAPSQDQLKALALALERARTDLREHPDKWSSRPTWRLAALPWALANEPEAAVQLVTLTELLAADEVPLEEWPWGSIDEIGGCLCVNPRTNPQPDVLAGYAFFGYLGTLGVESRLRIAELLSESGLTSDLEDMLYAMTVADVLREAELGDAADWTTIWTQMAQLSRERFDEYLSLFTRVGILKPGAGPP